MMVLLIGLAVVPVAVIAWLVDDWRRDLVTNVAETRADATDPLLRPLTVPETTAQIVGALREVEGRLAGWERVDEETGNSVRVVVRLVRTTRLLRFKDDITVTVEDMGDRRVISAVSQSRVGTGDLGQNPRNLRELLRELQATLAEAAGGSIPVMP